MRKFDLRTNLKYFCRIFTKSIKIIKMHEILQEQESRLIIMILQV